MTDITKYKYHFYLWEFLGYNDQGTGTSSGGVLKPLDMNSGEDIIEKPAGTKLLMFKNNVLLFSDFTRYKVLSEEGTIVQLTSAIEDTTNSSFISRADMGPDSDPLHGIYIW